MQSTVLGVLLQNGQLKGMVAFRKSVSYLACLKV